MDAMEDRTELNARLNLWVAFDYGGRAELVRGRAAARRERRRPRRDRRERLRREPVRARAARSRSRHPHLGRAARLELPALAARLRRARLRRQALARLRPARPPARARRVREPAPALRRPVTIEPQPARASSRAYARPPGTMSNLWSRLLIAAVGLPLVLGFVWLGHWYLFVLVARGRDDRAARVLRDDAAAAADRHRRATPA